MVQDFLRGPLGNLGTPVFRLGLSATYRPGRATVYKAIDEGLNYFLCFGFDTQMTSVLREAMGSNRDRFVLATGAYNWILWHQPLRPTLEKRLRQLKTDYIDLFHFFGVTRREHFSARVREELQEVRESGLVRGVAISTHDRALAAELAQGGALDGMMIRYNAASRGAETEIFEKLPPTDPAVVAYTATRWRQLLRRPRGYAARARVPSAGDCYRFVLSNPAVDVCLTAPRSLREFEEDLAAVRRGPLGEDDLRFMQEFGDVVRGRSGRADERNGATFRS